MTKVEVQMRKTIAKNVKTRGLVTEWIPSLFNPGEEITATFENGDRIDLWVDYGCINAPAIMMEVNYELQGAWKLPEDILQ